MLNLGFQHLVSPSPLSFSVFCPSLSVCYHILLFRLHIYQLFTLALLFLTIIWKTVLIKMNRMVFD